MTSFWSLWVIVLTSVSIALLTWILLGNRKRTDGETQETTGHNYDGIEEYDNPLPAWWFYMFLITIVWGIGYLVVYPGMGNYVGLLGWSQVGQYETNVSAAEEKHAALYQAYLERGIEEISKDPAAAKMGGRLFGNNCAQCHGADGAGSFGFPNLADREWIHGGTAEAIRRSIEDGRQAAMPPWGEVIGEEAVQAVTNYLLAKSATGKDAEPHIGKKTYDAYCSACHSPDATGNQALGAPNLIDGVWLYGGDKEQIAHSIRAGRAGNMPAHKETLSPAKIHLLTAYVYGLSH